MEFKLRNNRSSYNNFYHSCIELIIESSNTIITEDIVRLSDSKIDGSLIIQFEEILQEMKEHNEQVDFYNETIRKK